MEPQPHIQTQVNYYHILYYYSCSVSKIVRHYTPISQLHYIVVIKPSTNETIIDLDETEEETEEEAEFKTTWGE